MLQALAPELATAKPGALNAARFPDLKAVIRMGEGATPGMLRFPDVMSRGRDGLDTVQLYARESTLTDHDTINIQYTSGTTGNPKGATLTHHNVVNNGR